MVLHPYMEMTSTAAPSTEPTVGTPIGPSASTTSSVPILGFFTTKQLVAGLVSFVTLLTLTIANLALQSIQSGSTSTTLNTTNLEEALLESFIEVARNTSNSL
jgi:hypothetical protein